MTQDPYRYFRPEARNLLDAFTQGVLDLETNSADDGLVPRLLRLAHTLKGAARVVRQTAIAERAHAIEDALEPFRDDAKAVGRPTIDVILAHLGEIDTQLAGLTEAGATDGGSEKSGAQAVSKTVTVDGAGGAQARRVIGADIIDVEAVLDGVAETHARLNDLRCSAQTIEQIGHLADLVVAHLAAPTAVARSRAADDGRSHAAALAQELRRKIGNLAAAFDAAATQTDRELRQLRDTAEGLRLIAVDTMLLALKRTARDAAAATSKQVTFEGAGGDIRLDADVLGIIQGALIQIVRNAVAHGIEPQNERIAAGKPASGQVTVKLSRRGPKILIECRDDGRGIDLAAVRRAAVERGLFAPDAADLSGEELVRLLLDGGVSTAASVTDVSGRGVGLDVVREALQRLGGEVAVRTSSGHGTIFDFVVPRSVSAMTALLVQATPGANAVALPLDCVRRILRAAPHEIAPAATGASILYDGEAVPFIPLAAVLDDASWPAGRAWTALIVAGTAGTAAIGVERLIGTARTVVRPLPEYCGTNQLVAGAALDGEGNPQLVLDPDMLVAAAQSRRDSTLADGLDGLPAKRPVLVIDDSLTTRMLEKSILETAGYDVEVAGSAEEGLDLARHKPFAVILCDVEMPGIDGFTFVERVRADAALRDTPTILVTSRDAPEDRRRGRDVGAHGYIIKSEFNQAELLDLIRPMAG